jgi:hypothetical protein
VGLHSPSGKGRGLDQTGPAFELVGCCKTEGKVGGAVNMPLASGDMLAKIRKSSLAGAEKAGDGVGVPTTAKSDHSAFWPYSLLSEPCPIQTPPCLLGVQSIGLLRALLRTFFFQGLLPKTIEAPRDS